jgi:ribonuclease D
VSGLHFIFSRHVVKPPKFVHSIAMPETIPSLHRIPPIEAFDSPEVNDSDVTLISEPEFVAAHVAALRAAGSPLFVTFLVHRVRTYRPFPCLCVVMAPDGAVVAFDILALRNDLDGLRALLTDPDMVHVMRDPDMNLQILAESLGLYVSNVLPVDGPDGRVVVDWRIRPLTEGLLLIAAAAVRVLPSLARLKIETTPIEELLSEAQRYAVPEWPHFVFDDAEIGATVYEVGADDADRQIVVDLVKWRDATAAFEDEAPNFVASNECLRRIATAKPCTNELARELLAGVGTPYTDSLASDLVFIVRTHCDARSGPLLSKLGSP